jgi:hypothetical protein
MNRRHFLASSLFALPLLAALSRFAQAQAKPDPKAPLAKEGEGTGKALNYCENADKGKKKVCPIRAEKGREKQYCSGCQFYVAAGKKGKDEVGNCQILANNLVKAKGWCNTFAPKAT